MKDAILSQIYSTDKFDCSVLEDGIVETFFKAGVQIEAEDLIRIKEMNLRMTEGRNYCVLVSADFMASFSKEARELSASENFVMNTKAKALVINGIGQRMIAQFYLKVNKPCIKTKVFSDRPEAIEWLRSELSLN